MAVLRAVATAIGLVWFGLVSSRYVSSRLRRRTIALQPSRFAKASSPLLSSFHTPVAVRAVFGVVLVQVVFFFSPGALFFAASASASTSGRSAHIYIYVCVCVCACLPPEH